MSIRTKVYSALAESASLSSLGVTEDFIFSNYSMDNAPSREKPFIIIRFEETNIQLAGRGPRHVSIWIHIPREVGTDFEQIDPILQVVHLEMMNLREDEDVTEVKFQGKSSDLDDPAYGTITRNIAYDVLLAQAL